jgi:hypothetical protein
VIPRKIIWLFILFPLSAFSQQADDVLSKFFAVPINETVFLRWTIIAGNSCQDTYVERSVDGIAYERIGIIGGICGSPDQAMTYEYTDSLPLINTLLHYRLELGYYGYTSPKTVEIKRYNEQGYLLAPNPFSISTRLSFKNDDRDEYDLIINDMKGQIVLKMMTTGDEFIIPGLNLNSGLYVFRIFSEDQVLYKGKLLVN